MAPRYTNIVDIPQFSRYCDPYADRRGSGSLRPQEPLTQLRPDLHRPFLQDKLYLCWLGHSSVFLCLHGIRILIDPVFSQYISPVPGFGPKRYPGKPVTPEELPQIDLLLITHSHYDHLDRATILALDSQVRRYVVPSGVDQILIRFGIAPGKIACLSWYQSVEESGVRVICTPSHHGSARSIWDWNRTLWCSYVIQDDRLTLFNTGDGGFGPHFRDIHSRYGDMDLVITECGQYHAHWHGAHMFPEEGAEAVRILGAKLAVPVHWGAYTLSNHPWEDPPARFLRRTQELGIACHVPKLHETLCL